MANGFENTATEKRFVAARRDGSIMAINMQISVGCHLNCTHMAQFPEKTVWLVYAHK